MRIIIVEDEKRSSRGLKNLLLSISGECEVVAEVSDGQKAFELILCLQPDVVFTDIKMPIMDGISMIKAVQARGGVKTRFVIISAYEEFELARQAISLGVVEYLVKPLTLEDVEAVWKRLQEGETAAFCGEKGQTDLKSQYPDAHPLILRALDIIQCSYATKLSQKDLAENLGISAEYFSFLFSRDIGENYAKFLRRYRIEKAKILISTDAVPKDQIPYSVGFSDPKYFYRCFKEETGVNMTEYRKAKR